MAQNQAADRSEAIEWITDNPKVLGALWALTLLLTEIGPVLADGGGSTSGP